MGFGLGKIGRLGRQVSPVGKAKPEQPGVRLEKREVNLTEGNGWEATNRIYTELAFRVE